MSTEPSPREMDALVASFAETMRETMRDNAYKGGWRSNSFTDLISMLREEVDELEKSVTDRESADIVTAEAADVANVALMIADKVRLLEKHRQRRAAK